MRYLTLLSLLFLSFAANAAEPTLRHGMAMQGEAKYKAGFKHFDYVNPDAPKGGMVRLAAIGTFDNLNAYILKGVAATGMELTFDTLLESSADEAFSEYGLLAESMEVPEDRSWVIFHLRPEAKFRDGTAVTAQDVVFTYETLKTKGTPNFRLMYGSVQSAEAMGDCCVKFTFAKGDNRELPLVVGQMPVLSKNYYENVEFNQTTLDAPMGSGPYRVKTVDAGGKDGPRHGRDHRRAAGSRKRPESGHPTAGG
jgi:microcin C transport system substrate-binding protein